MPLLPHILNQFTVWNFRDCKHIFFHSGKKDFIEFSTIQPTIILWLGIKNLDEEY